MKDKTCICFSVVEFVGIMSDDHIGLVIKLPEVLDEAGIIFPVFAETGIVWEREGLDLTVTVPFKRRGKNIPGSLNIN